ncbi:hypothetical protein Tco_0656482 [Tanacetum coccineum]|uniref:Uncharacterized protein n=1 Tax=Tanacetum coccineum TaxID=301880 RepID=A0ABQ4X9L7_9ASTR
MKITQLITFQLIDELKFVKTFRPTGGSTVTNVKHVTWTSQPPLMFRSIIFLTAYEATCQKGLSKKRSSTTCIVDPTGLCCHTTTAPIAKSLKVVSKASFHTNTSSWTLSNLRTHAPVQDGHIVTETSSQRKGLQVMLVIQVSRQEGDMFTTARGEAEAFLADVECTTPYDQPQALTTTNMFQANHEDAYDSDVDEGPNAAVAFMDTCHTIVQPQQLQSMKIDDNTICSSVSLDTDAQNVPTEVSADTSDKQDICRLCTHKVKIDIETKLDRNCSGDPGVWLSVNEIAVKLVNQSISYSFCSLSRLQSSSGQSSKSSPIANLVIERLVPRGYLVFSKALPRERFATLLPLLGVKQMSPETLKDLQDESVSELHRILFHVVKVILWNAEERVVVPPGYSYECSCLGLGLRPLVKWISINVLVQVLGFPTLRPASYLSGYISKTASEAF